MNDHDHIDEILENVENPVPRPRPLGSAEIAADLLAANATSLANEDYWDAQNSSVDGGTVGAPAIVAAILAVSERLEALHGDLCRINETLRKEQDR
jgi:hypothetical protein